MKERVGTSFSAQQDGGFGITPRPWSRFSTFAGRSMERIKMVERWLKVSRNGRYGNRMMSETLYPNLKGLSGPHGHRFLVNPSQRREATEILKMVGRVASLAWAPGAEEGAEVLHSH